MRVASSLARHWRSAFSRGPGYESQPPGRSFELESVRGYFIDFRAKTLAAPAAEAARLPAAAAQRALGWWERTLSGEPEAPAEFSRLCDELERAGERAADGIRWPYAVAVPKYGLAGRWHSALAQGQIASVFVRAHALAGEDRHAALARAAIGPLVGEPGSDLVSRGPYGPVLEEVPSRPPSHILNGWIYALWGLWDVARGLGDESAAERFESSVGSLREMLARYDVGWWTLYGLYPDTPLRDLAKPFYHRLHTNQVEILYRLTGFPEFRQAARRWLTYDRFLHRAGAVAHKAAFVVARSMSS